MTNHYSTIINKPHAKAMGRSLQISFKEAVVAAHELRGKQLTAAKAFLSRVISKREPLRYFRYNHNVGHRAGSKGPARYPINTCKGILSVLESAEQNASQKGLQASSLTVQSILAQKGGINWRMGRKRTRGKRTHIEVVLTESPAQAPTAHRKPFTKHARGNPSGNNIPAETTEGASKGNIAGQTLRREASA